MTETAKMKTRRQRGTGRLFRCRGVGPWWTRTYHDGKPVERSTKTKNRREAEQILKRHLVEGPDNTPKELKKLDCDALHADLLTEYRINGRKSIDHLERRWRLHLRLVFGQMLAGKVETSDVNKYVAARIEEGAENASVNRELAILKRMFRLGVENKKLRAEAVPFIKMLRERNTRIGFLESRDQDSLARACGRHSLQMRAIFEIGSVLGWRYREIIDLRVRQVDLSAGTVRLDPLSTKNDRGREVPLTPTIRELLAQCIHGQPPDAFVFRRPNGQRVRNFRATWINCCKEANVEGLKFHDLRRTAARNLRNAGVAEEIIMRTGGWLTNSVFRRYSIVNTDDIADALAKLERRREAETLLRAEQAEQEQQEAPVPRPV
jgi:integrase